VTPAKPTVVSDHTLLPDHAPTRRNRWYTLHSLREIVNPAVADPDRGRVGTRARALRPFAITCGTVNLALRHASGRQTLLVWAIYLQSTTHGSSIQVPVSWGPGQGNRTLSADIRNTTVAPTLITAYRATHYCITAVEEPFIMRVDEHSEDLARCHLTHRVTTSAFLTAFNPYSQQTPEADNESAQQRLLERLRERGYACLDGLGVDPTGDWPAEPSLLVLGIPWVEAHAIGAEFAQNGLVWADADAVPRLVLLR